MAKKKTNADKALDRAAKLIQAQLETLPSAAAVRKVKELQQMATKAYRSSKNGTKRQAHQTGATHLSDRSRARIA